MYIKHNLSIQQLRNYLVELSLILSKLFMNLHNSPIFQVNLPEPASSPIYTTAGTVHAMYSVLLCPGSVCSLPRVLFVLFFCSANSHSRKPSSGILRQFSVLFLLDLHSSLYLSCTIYHLSWHLCVFIF
jgi:hypothetical protein